MSEVKYPAIKVRLTGCDGNAFVIVGGVIAALKKGGVPKNEIDAFQKEAFSGDYNHLLQTAMSWVEVS